MIEAKSLDMLWLREVLATEFLPIPSNDTQLTSELLLQPLSKTPDVNHVDRKGYVVCKSFKRN